MIPTIRSGDHPNRSKRQVNVGRKSGLLPWAGGRAVAGPEGGWRSIPADQRAQLPVAFPWLHRYTDDVERTDELLAAEEIGDRW
jgi:hypothetical protein